MISSRSRGQTVPLWTAAILSSLVLMFFAINYGNTMRWQIRAQSDADAAALAAIDMQTEGWNQLVATVYAADVEEFRIRKQIDNIYQILHDNGGCQTLADSSRSGATDDCPAEYSNAIQYLAAAVTRYTADAKVIQAIAQSTSYNNIAGSGNGGDHAVFLGKLNATAGGARIPTGANQNCVDPAISNSYSPLYGDCKFMYTLLSSANGSGLAIQERTPNDGASHDAYNLTLPTNSTPIALPSGWNKDLWAPLEIEIATCANVPPIIPSFVGLTTPDFQATARAAATAVMLEEDWLQPGASPYDPNTGLPFQPGEGYDNAYNGSVGSLNPTSPGTGPLNAYELWYGGSTNFAVSSTGLFFEAQLAQEMEAEVGWWGAIPIAPYNGAVSTETVSYPASSNPVGKIQCPAPT